MSTVVARVTHPERLAEADRALIDALYPSLRRYAAVVGSSDIEPDDLVQEAFYRVLRRGGLTDLANPGAYMRRTIVNIASNERRRLGGLRRILPRLAEEVTVDDADPFDVEEVFNLRPRDRAVLYLSAVEGYSYAEVGEAVGVTEAAARQIASRARRKLRRLFGEEGAH
ncbi:MAG: sigma-70 family RNA polymerase sigma factor [Acidimicrobiia bacterium]|nr:sigma-70 family RNA polymerase sigma factor [Acidimicrobiia bacterium]